MNSPHPSLAEFKRPPVTEAVLGIQFEPLEAMGTVQLGLAWQHFRDRFPKVEEKPPLPATFEQFGDRSEPRFSIQLSVTPDVPRPRLWFLTPDETRLVQVQQDRFIHNWRRVKGRGSYPRYEQLRASFARELEAFEDFLREQALGTVQPNQCEVTYVNELMAGNGWDEWGDVERILATWSPRYSDDFYLPLESVSQEVAYLIPGPSGEPVGRLRVTLQPVLNAITRQRGYALRLTAQGKPDGEGLDGVFRFLDRGHECAVRTFAAITTRYMHQRWGRSDAADT